jgi:hypothetical protein
VVVVGTVPGPGGAPAVVVGLLTVVLVVVGVVFGVVVCVVFDREGCVVLGFGWALS